MESLIGYYMSVSMEMDGSEVSCVDEENEKKMKWFGGEGGIYMIEKLGDVGERYLLRYKYE